MTAQKPGQNHPIDLIRAGMWVVDADGDRVGTVTHVTAGDILPEPGDPLPSRDADWAAGAFSEQAFELADRQAERLMSGGYLKVLGSGVHGVDRYVAADQIAEVDDDTVVLRVGRDVLQVQ
ncbi:hypothetical protein [Paractinoplanes atraurantiacus]|uniref:PRC-barrel domain-containing protein n=1 Tax=Paractinoplanes atraurantiacus TaxID=1036182 RepID=A0A285GPT3_9ACTN|nr:hypothetical protein [Actinoplanes atraurantiacus]SNY25547.1 hypothetical protein SAMN05421748_102361 [Actinoplanes atraurantiacus]